MGKREKRVIGRGNQQILPLRRIGERTRRQITCGDRRGSGAGRKTKAYRGKHQRMFHHLPDIGRVLKSTIVFSADDFGLTHSVNAAVELAHTQGVLTQASLMVAAPAASDAVRRAKNLPGLNTGLHLVLVDGNSCLGHAKLPHITTPRRQIPEKPGGFGREILLLPRRAPRTARRNPRPVRSLCRDRPKTPPCRRA